MAAAGINKRDLEGFGLGLGVGLAIGLGICWLIRTAEGQPQPCPAGYHRENGICVPDNGNGNMVRIDVNSEDQLGRPTQGNFIQLYDENENPVSSGFTPTSFDVEVNRDYYIEAQDCFRSTGCAFDYNFDTWKGETSAARRHRFRATQDTTFTAVYDVS